MTRIAFSDLQSRDLVARYFALPPDFPGCFLAANRHDYYQKMQIPKRNARRTGFRTVYKTTDRILRNFQKQLAIAVENSFKPDRAAHGFIKGRSTLTNAAPHSGADIVLRLDIRNFFESIQIGNVAAAFVSTGASKDAAALLSELATLDGHLIQGASSSPAISNLVCVKLDEALGSIARAHAATYTRYSDDLTFSGAVVPELPLIEQALEVEGFALAWEKVRYQRKGRFQYVTGLSVANPQGPRAPRRLKRWLRSVVHVAGTYGVDALVERFDDPYRQSYEIARIDGCIAYLYGIESKAAAELDRIWQPAIAENGRGIALRRQSLYVSTAE